MTVAVQAPMLLLPWSASHGEDARFRRLLAALLVLFAALAALIPQLTVPEPARRTLPQQPQLARVILEKQPLPAAQPKPAAATRTEAPRPLAKPRPTVPAEPVPPSRQQPKTPRETRAGGGSTAGTGREKSVELMRQARETAARSGVLQFRDDLAAMRESVDVAAVTRSNLTRGTGQAEKTERSLIAGRADAGAGSGGIDTAALSRDTGGIALSGRETTRIDGGVGGGRGVERVAGRPGGAGVGFGTGASDKKGDLVAGSDNAAGRSDEAIRRVMDRNKGAIFAIYNRALRENAALQGRFVFEMVIEPGGQVSEVKLISSQLADQGLAAKILARIRLIDFGAARVLRTRVNYSFDFLPY